MFPLIQTTEHPLLTTVILWKILLLKSSYFFRSSFTKIFASVIGFDANVEAFFL